MKLIREGRLTDARRALEAMGEPRDADVLGMLGMVCGMAGDLQAAEPALKRAVSLRPSDPALRNNFGCVLRALGKKADAEAQFRESVRLDPRDLGARANLGCALIDSGNLHEAERVLRNVLATVPEHPEALNNLGTALRGIGKIAEATACYEKAVRLRPNYPDALANLGMSRLFDNRSQEAERCLRAALQWAPGHVQALYYLGFLLHQRNARSEAESCFRNLLAIDPTHANAAYFLSVIGVSEAPPQSPSAYVKELFDGYAESFEEHLVGALKYSAPGVMSRLVRTQLGASQGSLDILDLGCGTGLCARQFTDLAATITGVDLSARMLDKVRPMGIYDRLIQDDVVSFLTGQQNTFDLILAGDLFIYIGDLAEVIPACARALRDGAIMCFSTEKSDDHRPYTLRTSGRYAQRSDYIIALARESGLSLRASEQLVLREEYGAGITGEVYVLAKEEGPAP